MQYAQLWHLPHRTDDRKSSEFFGEIDGCAKFHEAQATGVKTMVERGIDTETVSVGSKLGQNPTLPLKGVSVKDDFEHSLAFSRQVALDFLIRLWSSDLFDCGEVLG